MQEEWRDINGYEGLYQVSNLGRIKSLDRKVKGKNGIVQSLHGKILSLQFDKDRYYMVILSKNGKETDHKVHRLVAQAFIPNPYHYPEVNHKDENKQNNRVDNLEWCTAKYNTNYGTAMRRMVLHHHVPKNNASSKAAYQYTKEGKFVKEWPSIRETIRAGFKDTCSCCLGKTKSCKGYIWKYAKSVNFDKGNLSRKELKKYEYKKTHNMPLNTANSKPVLQYTLNNKFVKRWPSASEAGRNGYDDTHIRDCCRGKNHTHKGYIWKYASDIKAK